MYSIPTTVDIDGEEFHIRNNGDYRMVLDCFSALNDPELNTEERLFASLIIFYEGLDDFDDIESIPNLELAVNKMFEFFNCGTTDPNARKVPYKLVDWDKDSQLICSAVNKVANTEIRSVPYIHWWTFMGYYSAIGECPLSTILSIRDKIMKGKKLEKHEREFRTENPNYFIWNSKTVEQEEADRLVKELWNSGD